MMTKFIDRKYGDKGNGPNIGGWSGTKDWFSVEKTLQVPAGAEGIALMPCLFNAAAGRMHIRNLVVEAQRTFTESKSEKDSRLERERQEKARFVADEEENRAKWPRELRVQGNRLVDPSGKEVWLQGVNAGGMQALVDAVRSTGAKNIVLASGMFWANDLTGIESEDIEKGAKTSFRLRDPDGNGIVYEWHTYHWHKGWARILPVAAKHPVFLGEVGAAPKDQMTFINDAWKEDPYTFSPNMIGFIQKHRINWTAWCFHPKAAPCIIKSWDYDPTPYWGDFVKRALRGEQFEFKRMK